MRHRRAHTSAQGSIEPTKEGFHSLDPSHCERSPIPRIRICADLPMLDSKISQDPSRSGGDTDLCGSTDVGRLRADLRNEWVRYGTSLLGEEAIRSYHPFSHGSFGILS